MKWRRTRKGANVHPFLLRRYLLSYLIFLKCLHLGHKSLTKKSHNPLLFLQRQDTLLFRVFFVQCFIVLVWLNLPCVALLPPLPGSNGPLKFLMHSISQRHASLPSFLNNWHFSNQHIFEKHPRISRNFALLFLQTGWSATFAFSLTSCMVNSNNAAAFYTSSNGIDGKKQQRNPALPSRASSLSNTMFRSEPVHTNLHHLQLPFVKHPSKRRHCSIGRYLILSNNNSKKDINEFHYFPQSYPTFLPSEPALPSGGGHPSIVYAYPRLANFHQSSLRFRYRSYGQYSTTTAFRPGPSPPLPLLTRHYTLLFSFVDAQIPTYETPPPVLDYVPHTLNESHLTPVSIDDVIPASSLPHSLKSTKRISRRTSSTSTTPPSSVLSSLSTTAASHLPQVIHTSTNITKKSKDLNKNPVSKLSTDEPAVSPTSVAASPSETFPLNTRQRKKKGLCSHCGSPHERDARFCCACGCPLKTRRETLREFVTKRLFAMRKEEVGMHTMRVERGFWKLILEHLGDIPVMDLTSSHWESYLRKLRDRGCSPRTQALHQIAYQAALKYAVFTQKIPAVHPFRSIRGTTKRTMKTIPLTVTEVHKLLDKSSSQMYRSMFTMGIGLGLRPSEIVRMRWEDVDFDKSVIRIRGTKTKASFTSIPITTIAYKELQSWWIETNKPKRGLCFFVLNKSKKDPTKLEKKDIICFKKALQAAAARAGICVTDDGEQRRIFPYILRHSFATIAATSTPPVPLPVAQAVMRHTSSKMLLETYARAGTLIIKEGLKNFNL